MKTHTTEMVVSKVLSSTNQLSADKLMVQKSLPMTALWRSQLSLAEFKLLDLYLSRIDSRKSDQRWVRFEKGEIEHLLGVKYIKPEELKKRLRNLCMVVELPNPDAPGAFDAISLFERAVCVPDSNGVWQIDLQCTPSAMKYIFNIENIGYLRYRLRAICTLSSRYSYILFLYIETNRFRVSWDSDLGELRKLLGCDSEFYSSYKQFNQHILRRCLQELSEKTDCRFSYEPLKQGRKVYGVRFTVSPDFINSPAIPTQKKRESSSPIDQIETEISSVSKTATFLSFLQSACCFPGTGTPEFTLLETNHLLQLIRQIPPSCLPQWTPGGDLEFAMYHYLAEQYAAMCRYSEKKPVKSRISYLLSMIRKDIPAK